MNDPEAVARAAALDVSVSPADRIAALRVLSDINVEKAIQIAIEVSENAAESVDMLTAAGKELARIALNGRWLTEFEVRNMNDLAFDSYCKHFK